MKGLVYILSFFLAITVFVGCKTKYVAVPEVHYRDSVHVKHTRDSIFLHDSVFSTVYVKGDTVFSEKYKTRYIYKNIMRVDTVLRTIQDSVPYPVEVVKDKYVYTMRWYEKLFMRIGIACTLCFVVLVILLFIKNRSI